MAQSILIFDFGTNEEEAQQARHKVDAWRQGFRLGDKLSLKFDREESAGEKDAQDDAPEPSSKSGKAKSGAKSEKTEGGNVRLLVRLDFSDHEKLTHQRWLDRIPTEEPFKSAKSKTIRTGDPEFPKTAELFESIDFQGVAKR